MGQGPRRPYRSGSRRYDGTKMAELGYVDHALLDEAAADIGVVEI